MSIKKEILQTTIPATIIMLIFLEFFFRFIIPASNAPNAAYDSNNMILKYEKNQNGIWRKGPFNAFQAKYRINNEGWNSKNDYQFNKSSKKRICVIGDSYVEGMQVDVDKIFPTIIENTLNENYDIEVYSFGISGAPLSAYYNMVKYVSANYMPEIIIINLIYNDFDESIENFYDHPYFHQYKIDNNGQFIESKPNIFKPNRLNRFLKNFAIVRYIMINLEIINLNILKKLFFKKDQSSDMDQNIYYQIRNNKKNIINYYENIDDITKYIFTKIKKHIEENNIELIFSIDGWRYFIYEGKNPKSAPAYLINEISMKNADRLDIPIIDLTETFKNDYFHSKKRFEFENDRHWNTHGHYVVGKSIANKIKSLGWLHSN